MRVRLLGGFALAHEGHPITLEAPRLQALLGFLVLHSGTPQPREQVAFLFWPDSEEPQARTNLRHALHLLRRALPEPELYLDGDARTLTWRADAPCEVDVRELEELLERASTDPDAERESLEAAAAIYRGDLLPGCYDDWVVPERERLRDRFLDGAARLADLLEGEREYRVAIPWARRLVDHAPLNEDACLRLMRLSASTGDRAGALRAYHGCATALAREMGVSPSPALRDAYERLLEPERGDVGLRAAPADASSALVGRRREWAVLTEAWERAADGRSLLAVISGEAGIGKSRLAEELLERVRRQGFGAVATRSYSAAGSLAYGPVVEILRSPQVAPRVSGLDAPWRRELARLLPELLAGEGGIAPPPPLTDDWQRARLFDALANALLGGGRPFLLVIDDLQWCDGETLAWLDHVQRLDEEAPLLVLGTVRPEEVGPGHPLETLLIGARLDERAIEVDLGPFDRDEAAALARSLAGRDVDERRAEALFSETEGNPLFVVEWVRAGFLDDEAEEAELRELPPRARALIDHRLTQLSPPAQELAALAATVGRAFELDVLRAASSQPEEQVVDALDELWRRRIVRERGAYGYDFSHDKIRDAAYALAGPARRSLLHTRVAQALERLRSGDLESVGGQLAAHYEQAGWSERAIEFYVRAAAAAQRVYSNEKAIDLLSRALELLRDEPETRARDELELTVQTAIGVPLVIVKGYGSPEVTNTWLRAWELCERLGEEPGAPVLRGLGLSCLSRGELGRAHDLAERLLELGEQDDDPMVRVEGTYLLGVTTFWLGDFEGARVCLDRAIAEYVPERAQEHLALYSQDPRVICTARLAYTLWYLGSPDEAEAAANEAIRLAEGLEHSFSLGYALTFACWLALDSGDEARASVLGRRLAELAEAQRLGYLQPVGIVMDGWGQAAEGDPEAGIARIREGIDVYRLTGETLYMSWTLALLARACIEHRRFDEARAALSEALGLVEVTGQRHLESELERLSGELVLAEGGDREEAEAHLTRAIEVARRQTSPPLEERAERSRNALPTGRRL